MTLGLLFLNNCLGERRLERCVWSMRLYMFPGFAAEFDTSRSASYLIFGCHGELCCLFGSLAPTPAADVDMDEG